MERVGAVLRDLGGGENLRRRLAQARAFELWPALVGNHLAERTRPLRVTEGRLIVLAPGGALRQELTFHTRTILRKFNEAAGGRVAREVVFVEADSLAHEGEAFAPRTPVEDTERAGDAPAGADPDPESDQADPGEEEEVGAMYEPFDAEEYRRGLQDIAGAGERDAGKNEWEKA